MMVDVIIPSMTTDNTAPMVADCIRSLRDSESWIEFNVMLVESGEVIDVGQDASIIYDRDVFNYNHALNLGIEASKESPWIVLANNDLLFHRLWMSEIILASHMRSDIKSFSPWNSHNDWHEKIFPDADHIIEGYDICCQVAGWCLVTSRSVLWTIGKLDERVNFWYSDNIYRDALVEHHFKHALVRDSRVDHLTSQTVDFGCYDSQVDLQNYMMGKQC